MATARRRPVGGGCRHGHEERYVGVRDPRELLVQVAHRCPTLIPTDLLQGESVQSGTTDDGRTGYVATCEPKGLLELFLDGGARIRLTNATDPSSC